MAERSPSAPALEHAVRHVTACVRWLRADARTAAVVSRGGHPLWSAVVERLRGAGQSVHWTLLDERDGRWKPAGTAVQSGAPDVLVHHDPFLPAPREPGSLADLRRLVGAGTACVFVDLPHGIRDARLAARLDEVYLRALAAAPQRIAERGARLADALREGTSMEIADGDRSVLRVAGPWRVRHDFTSARMDCPVLQLPLGETWLVIEPERVNGELTVQHGRDRSRLRLRDGQVRGDGPLAAALAGLGAVEVGFGINPAAQWIAGTDLCEKADRSIHVGFGDSSLIGGDLVADEHVDVFLPLGSEVWMVRGGGDRVRVGVP